MGMLMCPKNGCVWLTLCSVDDPHLSLHAHIFTPTKMQAPTSGLPTLHLQMVLLLEKSIHEITGSSIYVFFMQIKVVWLVSKEVSPLHTFISNVENTLFMAPQYGFTIKHHCQLEIYEVIIDYKHSDLWVKKNFPSHFLLFICLFIFTLVIFLRSSCLVCFWRSLFIVLSMYFHVLFMYLQHLNFYF